MQISGIIIQIQGKKYAIDMVKARELYHQLDELFGTKDTTYVPYPITTPSPVIYPQPYWSDDMWKWSPTTIYGGTAVITTNHSDNELRIDNWDLSSSGSAYTMEEDDDTENYFEIEVDLEEIDNE
jgi:hypothetical protein